MFFFSIFVSVSVPVSLFLLSILLLFLYLFFAPHFRALHLRAKVTFQDVYGIERKAGKEWLVTSKMAPVHILGVYEEKVADVQVFKIIFYF